MLSVYLSAFMPLTVTAERANSPHTPTAKILEFSLSRLMESLHKIEQKNERLTFENKALRESIHRLQKEKDILVAKKAERTGKLPNTYQSKKKERSERPVDTEERQARTQELILIFQHDIKELEDRKRVLEMTVSEQEFHDQKQTLLGREKRSAEDVLRAEKELRVLEKRNKKPLKKIEALKKEQNELADQVRELQKQVNLY